MAVPQQEDKDKISAKVLKQLSQTIYACSSLTQLSSRPGNFVYRGTLCQSFTNEDGAVATSIIVKHFIQDVNSHRDNPRNILRCVSMDHLGSGRLNTLLHGGRPPKVADVNYLL